MALPDLGDSTLEVSSPLAWQWNEPIPPLHPLQKKLSPHGCVPAPMISLLSPSATPG